MSELFDKCLGDWLKAEFGFQEVQVSASEMDRWQEWNNQWPGLNGLPPKSTWTLEWFDLCVGDETNNYAISLRDTRQRPNPGILNITTYFGLDYRTPDYFNKLGQILEHIISVIAIPNQTLEDMKAKHLKAELELEAKWEPLINLRHSLK